MRSVLKAVSFTLVLLVLALGTAAVLPFALGDGETLQLDDAARGTLHDLRGFSFVQLSDGYTCYREEGRPDGAAVVFVHGFSGPMAVWDNTVPALARAGFRTLRYDLYGRGYSDRPRAVYSADLFDRQLSELLDRLGITDPVNLIGLSMGGAIVTHFIDRHPERVNSFSLLAPAGFSVHEPLRYRVLYWPGVGEWLFQVGGKRILTAAVERMNVPQASTYRHDLMDQMNYAGFRRALLSTFRNMPLLTLEPAYRRVGGLAKPSLLVWGTADHVLPFEHHKLVQDTIPGIEFHAIPGADHAACYETPNQVNPILYEFLKRVAR